MISCDLGSNTIRFVEIECESKKRVQEFEKIVKTADGLKQTGKISKDALARVIKAIKEAGKIFDFSKGVEAVTTEALRVATNQKEVLDEIFLQTGLRFEVLSGEEEAFFTNIAVKNQIDDKSYLLIDIGGGSTEISIVENDTIISKSFDLGIVTLTQEYGIKNLRKGLEKKILEVKKFFKDKNIPKKCIATAGTPTTIASFLLENDYQNYDYVAVNGMVLTLTDIKNTEKKLLSMDEQERKRWVGVGREDLIISGIEIFLEVLKVLDFRECIVIDDGLREGIALYMCKNF